MSIIAGLVVSGITYTFAKTDESMKIDEQTQKKYAKAYERQVEAVELIKAKKQLADDTLMKVANRKRAILSTSMHDFIKLYERIIQINFVPGEGILELNQLALVSVKISEIKQMTVSAMSPMSEKEIVNVFLINGLKGLLIAGPIGAVANAIGGTMVQDSKHNLSKANSQLKISSIVYSQAETMGVALDAIAERSEKIATLLAKLNYIFIRLIKNSTEIIDKNSFDRNNYNTEERKNLMTSINVADAIKKILDTPLLDINGGITQESLNALQIGSKYLQEIEQL